MESKKLTIRQHYSQAFKKQVVEDYLSSGTAKKDLHRKYGIRGQSAIGKWLKLFGYDDVYIKNFTLDATKHTDMPRKLPSKETLSSEQLQAKVALLERQLEDEQLLNKMLNRMVDLAEEKYKIPVRKNSVTK